MYTHDRLKLGVDRNGHYQAVEEYMLDASSSQKENSLFKTLKENNIYPCWYCGESEYLDFPNYYVPFYDLSNSRLEGILILQKKDAHIKEYYLSYNMVKQIAQERTEPYSEYWQRIMVYFSDGPQGKDKKDHFNSRTEVCIKGAASCFCSVSYVACGSWGTDNDLQWYYDCDAPCGSDGSGGDSGGSDNDDGGPLTIADVNTWISGNDPDGAGGGSNPLNPNPDEPWDDFCGEFNGSLGTAGNNTLNPDGSTDIPIFENPADLYLLQLNSIINQYGMQSQFTPQELMEYIGEQCAVSNVSEVSKCIKCHLINDLGLSDDQNYILMNNFDVVADCNGDMDCLLAGIIENSDCKDYLDDFMSFNGLELSLEAQWAIIDLTQNSLGQSNCTDFPNKAWTATVNFATGSIQSPSDILLLVNFIKTVDDKKGLLDYYELITSLRDEDPDIRWDRSIDLYDLLIDNPNALTECGDPAVDVAFWSDLASFVPPQEVLDKLEDLGEGWRLQGFLTPTATPSINLDYFSTTITQMPIDTSTNQPWVPEVLFEHIRKNFNDFVDTDNSEFTPILGDENLWLSSDPVPAVITIDIDIPIIGFQGDDGSVICAQNESCCWIFSTVKAPFFENIDGDGGNDGYHPVSGNRQFGYTIHSDGSMEIYTKGADRFLTPTSGPLSNSYFAEKLAGYLLEKAAFTGADNLWKSFQEGINNFGNDPSNGGISKINTPIKNRPKVKDELKNLLRQSGPINYVPCGN
jgi:hypothetical protein